MGGSVFHLIVKNRCSASTKSEACGVQCIYAFPCWVSIALQAKTTWAATRAVTTMWSFTQEFLRGVLAIDGTLLLHEIICVLACARCILQRLPHRTYHTGSIEKYKYADNEKDTSWGILSSIYSNLGLFSALYLHLRYTLQIEPWESLSHKSVPNQYPLHLSPSQIIVYPSHKS